MKASARHPWWWPLVLACAPAPPAPEPPAPVVEQDGYAAPMLSGHQFVADAIEVVAAQQALDLDGNGTPDGAVNRALEPMREALNSAFRNSLQTDRICVAVELAGLEAPYRCQDRAVTLKYYTCSDADQDPSNNFCGAPDCGHMVIDADVVDLEQGQARYRTQPAPVVDCRVRAWLDQPIQVDLGEDDLQLEDSQLAAFVPDSLDELLDLRIAGVATARAAQEVIIPLCDYLPVLCLDPGTPREISLAAYMRLIGEHPDVDRDGDGLERYDLDSQAAILRCVDGDGTVIENPGCLTDPRMADAFSMCLGGHAVSAVLLPPP